MIGTKKWAFLGMTLYLCGSTPSAHAESFTTGQFLTQGRQSQETYIGISLTMAGAITAQTNPGVARCLNDWYFADSGRRAERIDYILETMRKYPEYHPSGVIVAVIKKVCGSL